MHAIDPKTSPESNSWLATTQRVKGSGLTKNYQGIEAKSVSNGAEKCTTHWGSLKSIRYHIQNKPGKF